MLLSDTEAIYRVVYSIDNKYEPQVVYTPHRWQVENLETLHRVHSVSVAVAVWVASDR